MFPSSLSPLSGLLACLALGAPFAHAAPRAACSTAPDEVRVVCTIPDLADAVKRIGGERVAVHCLARGTENVHAVRVRPSDLNQTSRADLFVEVGLSLEHAFVPGLLENARNKAIQPGAPGFVNCSDGWQAIDVPEAVSRSDAADLHPFGNPHFNLDPRGGRHIAARVLAGLCRVAPGDADAFRATHAQYLQELDVAEALWAEAAKSLAGKKVVSYHTEFDYFLRSRGIELIGTIEPRPGVPPTPRDLAAIVARMKAEHVGVILTAPWSNDRSVRFVAEKAGAKVVELPTLVGGAKGAETWISMMNLLHERLVSALAPEEAKR